MPIQCCEDAGDFDPMDESTEQELSDVENEERKACFLKTPIVS